MPHAASLGPTAYPAGSCLPEKIWLYVTVADCLTEALIMALPFWIIWNVRIPRRKKWLIQTLFAFRIVTIAIIAACIPALKPFLEWSAGRIAGTISSSSGNASASAAAAYAAYAVNRRSSRPTRGYSGCGDGSSGAEADGKMVYRMRAFSGTGVCKTRGRVTDRATGRYASTKF
ncbi:putative integral membrane protein [Diplodia seriata]|uniref:Putative integral membrane protein n=1 Tax=Diplodia seriata TaxID=420778 RepID=A0A0G2DSI4_9PEZI|nr:putative integral membrane protein [Diplodia seriata]